MPHEKSEKFQALERDLVALFQKKFTPLLEPEEGSVPLVKVAVMMKRFLVVLRKYIKPEDRANFDVLVERLRTMGREARNTHERN